jgi:hypothetical protein
MPVANKPQTLNHSQQFKFPNDTVTLNHTEGLNNLIYLQAGWKQILSLKALSSGTWHYAAQ